VGRWGYSTVPYLTLYCRLPTCHTFSLCNARMPFSLPQPYYYCLYRRLLLPISLPSSTYQHSPLFSLYLVGR